MRHDAHQHAVLMHIGKIAGMKRVAIIQRVNSRASAA